MAHGSSPSRDAHWLSFLVLFPFHALYGAHALIRIVLGLPHRVRALSTIAAPSIPCPNGHRNPTHGRFGCASCHGTYHGWVGRCGLCSAPAGFLACETCGVSIALPWER